VGASVFGAQVNPFTVSNPGATATDNAVLEAAVSGPSGGDPQLRLTIPGGTSYYVGVDNSASDTFCVGTGTAVGSSIAFAVTTDGRFGTRGIPVAGTDFIVQGPAASNCLARISTAAANVGFAALMLQETDNSGMGVFYEGTTNTGSLRMFSATDPIAGPGSTRISFTRDQVDLGFFTATPVVQQSTTGTTGVTAAGAGTALKDDTTMTGGVGTRAFTVPDVIRALKNYGLLAST
jgi:hypothetical protein